MHIQYAPTIKALLLVTHMQENWSEHRKEQLVRSHIDTVHDIYPALNIMHHITDFLGIVSQERTWFSVLQCFVGLSLQSLDIVLL